MGSPDRAAHSRTVRSCDDAVTTYLPFGLNCALMPPPARPLRTPSLCPPERSRFFTVPSRAAVSSDRLSGLNAAAAINSSSAPFRTLPSAGIATDLRQRRRFAAKLRQCSLREQPCGKRLNGSDPSEGRNRQIRQISMPATAPGRVMEGSTPRSKQGGFAGAAHSIDQQERFAFGCLLPQPFTQTAAACARPKNRSAFFDEERRGTGRKSAVGCLSDTHSTAPVGRSESGDAIRSSRASRPRRAIRRSPEPRAKCPTHLRSGGRAPAASRRRRPASGAASRLCS